MAKADRVTGVNIYPIKSLQAATIEGRLPRELGISPTGFMINGVIDREYMLMEDDGLFVSQRGWDAQESSKHPNDKTLASISVDIREEHLRVGNDQYGHIDIPTRSEDPGDSTMATMFGNELSVIKQPGDSSEFFSDILERPVSLVRLDQSQPRFVKERYRRHDTYNRVAGADGMPFLLASQASLAFLLRQAGLYDDALSLDRFRANIEIDGSSLEIFGEDRINEFSIGKFGGYIVKACSRCPIPNIDQVTGEKRDNMATKILLPRRGWKAGDEQVPRQKRPYFAQNVLHKITADDVTVAVGDVFEVESWLDGPNVLLAT